MVARYGPGAAGAREFVDAANRKPLLEAKSIAQACGTCLARAA
jgi:hypothetical protein